MKKLICNKTFDKKKINQLVDWFTYNYGSTRTNKLINRLKYIGFKYSTSAGLSLGPEDLIIPIIKKRLIKDTSTIVKKKYKQLKKGKITKQNLLQKKIEIWNLTNEKLKNEIIKNFRQKDLLNPVYMMTLSGARGNLSQIKQLIGMRGLMSDSKGRIINLAIKSNLKEGLKSKEYFISCYGARKGIIDTALKTANSGYLTRKLIYVSQNTIIKQHDCKTKKSKLIKLQKKNKKSYNETKNKITGTIIDENINGKNNKITISKGQDICPYIAKKIIREEKYIYIRSVLTCQLNIGLCQLCYGWNLGTNKLVRIGEAVGIIASQSIGEPGTQLTMRTFHTGGIFTSKSNMIITSPHNGKLIYNEKTKGKKIKNKFNEQIFFLLEEKNVFIKKNEISISKVTLPKYSTIFLKNGKSVFQKQTIAEIKDWKTEKKLKSEKVETKNQSSGETYFEIKKGKIKKKLWILNGNILQIKRFFKNIIEKRKEIKILSKNSKIVKKEKIITQKLIKLNFEKNKYFRNSLKKSIKKKTYIIYKITKEKDKLMLIKNARRDKIKYKNLKQKIGKNSKEGIITEAGRRNMKLSTSKVYLIPTKAKIEVLNNELIERNTTIFKAEYKEEKTSDIIEGLPKIEEILEVKRSKETKQNLNEKVKLLFERYNKKYTNKIANEKTIEKIQNLLMSQIQKVYKSQDVNIAEKHIAIVIKKMTSKVTIKQKGDSELIEGEIIDIKKIKNINKNLKNKANYEPILIGISKISLLTEGFISASCFQETIRVLAKSALKGKVDWLSGLKENIIFGNLIPSGTGKKKLIE